MQFPVLSSLWEPFLTGFLQDLQLLRILFYTEATSSIIKCKNALENRAEEEYFFSLLEDGEVEFPLILLSF